MAQYCPEYLTVMNKPPEAGAGFTAADERAYGDRRTTRATAVIRAYDARRTASLQKQKCRK